MDRELILKSNYIVHNVSRPLDTRRCFSKDCHQPPGVTLPLTDIWVSPWWKNGTALQWVSRPGNTVDRKALVSQLGGLCVCVIGLYRMIRFVVLLRGSASA